MNRVEAAVREINLLEEQSKGNSRLHKLPALLKVLLAVWYLLMTMSFDQYNIFGLLAMGIYPLALFLLYDISFFQCLKRIKVILPFLVIAGILNPPVSMLSLIVKGFFAVLAGYLLIVSTGMEKICGALRQLHIPSVLVTMILLIYRYIVLLLKETDRIMQAYRLRAPGQRGVQIRVWGSLVGMLLLRSMDRAQDVYESMCLRGFDGTGRGNAFYYTVEQKPKIRDYLYFFTWMAVMLFLRICPVFILVGKGLLQGAI